MIKEEQIVKLITVTITDIFVQNDLVAHKLLAVELRDDIVRVGFIIENSTLPENHNPSYSVDLRVADLQEWIEKGVGDFVNKLEFALAESIQVKTGEKDEN